MVTKTRRPQSSQALAAAAIRKQLKTAYPHTTFRVTSDSFAGGDSVSIHWTDGPTADQVEAIADKHQYGHFDGSIDMYEYSNSRDDIPQAKYVTTTRTMSDDAQRAAVAHVNTRYGWHLELVEMKGYRGLSYLTITNDEHTGRDWKSSEIHRTFHATSLVCPACLHDTMISDAYCPECGSPLT
ncbi:MAG TPA: LPD29 domain-containing protein [Gemmatimonadaceae bacterium]|nr:LPD29 domain-containing protein [Gemmatimonadaceae bacterium]